MEYKCEEAEIKYESTIQNQIMYERFLLKIMNYIQENMERSKGDSSGYVGLKSSKTRFEQIEGDKRTENLIFDSVTIFKKAQMDEHKPKADLMEKYYKTQKELKD